MTGTSGEAALSWSACDFKVEIVAEVVVNNRVDFVRDGAKNEIVLNVVPSQPAGTTFVRTCSVVGGGCDDYEDLRLIGRMGNGYWELAASWANPDEPDGPAMRAWRERRFAGLMVNEWRNAAG
jgi:hypothetical protein